MAEKRMFSKKIVDTDWFMDMPASSQNLYFHLSMRADDDGFVASPKRIMKLIGASEDDYKVLISKSFIIPFESGVCVITDWRINNYLRNDRYTETVYKEEKEQLNLNENGKYVLGIPVVDRVLSNSNSNSNSISNSISNSNEEKEIKKEKETKHKYGEYKNVLLTDTELGKLTDEFTQEKTEQAITYLDEYIEMKGYKARSHYLAIRKWVFDALKERKQEITEKKQTTGSNFIPREYTETDFNNIYADLDNVEI